MQTIPNRRQSKRNECRDYGSLAECLPFSVLLTRLRRRRAQYGKIAIEGKPKFRFGFVCATRFPRRARKALHSPVRPIRWFHRMPDIHSLIVGKLSPTVDGETEQTNQSDCDFSPKRLHGTLSLSLLSTSISH